MDKTWYVYILQCADGTLYTGITTDVDRRLNEHNSGKGAKYTRTRLPVMIVAVSEAGSRSEASKEEYRIKQLTKKEKIKEPIRKVDPDCKNTQIIFLENSNNKLSEQLIRKYIQNILLGETTNLNKPYGKGDVKDMLLDEEGWVTDPNDRQKIKKR